MRRFGALEAAAMEVLWSVTVGPASMSVREVLQQLRGNRSSAHTTFRTVLDNLHRTGSVTRARDGRAWRYRPAMCRDAHTAEMISELPAGSSDPQSVILHLLPQLSQDEALQLRVMLGQDEGSPS